jgi:hypothetical protein
MFPWWNGTSLQRQLDAQFAKLVRAPVPTSAPGLGSPLPTSAPGPGSPLPTSAPGSGSPMPHLRRDRAHRCHTRDGLAAAHVCAGTGPAACQPPASAGARTGSCRVQLAWQRNCTRIFGAAPAGAALVQPSLRVTVRRRRPPRPAGSCARPGRGCAGEHLRPGKAGRGGAGRGGAARESVCGLAGAGHVAAWSRWRSGTSKGSPSAARRGRRPTRAGR